MSRKYHNVFITGDLHLGDSSFNYEEPLVSILKNNKFDCAVFGGDTFDLWRGKSLQSLIAEYYLLFKELQKMRIPIIFLRGNHDREIDFLKKMGFIVKKGFKYISGAGEKVKIIHGDQFDRDCRRVEFITRKLVYLEEKVNQVISKIDDSFNLRLINLLGNIDLKRIVDNFYNKIKSYQNIDHLLFGHLHIPWEGKKDNLNFYNWGSWQKDFGLAPSYIINKEDKVDLRYI